MAKRVNSEEQEMIEAVKEMAEKYKKKGTGIKKISSLSISIKNFAEKNEDYVN